jgi:hypothetical protein
MEQNDRPKLKPLEQVRFEPPENPENLSHPQNRCYILKSVGNRVQCVVRMFFENSTELSTKLLHDRIWITYEKNPRAKSYGFSYHT